MNPLNIFLSALFIGLGIFSITPSHAVIIDASEAYYDPDLLPPLDNDSANTLENMQKEENERITKAEKKASELWQIIINNQTQDIQSTLAEYINSLQECIKKSDIDFQDKENKILKAFPHSPEHLCAIAETYLILPNLFCIETSPSEEGDSIKTIYDPSFNNKKSLDRFIKAFDLAKQQKKNKLAADIALRIANRLIKPDSSKDLSPSIIFTNQLTPIEENPTYQPTSKYPSVSERYFQIFQMPEKFETSKNDGERILWLFHEAKMLDPTRKNEIDLIWANLMKDWFVEGCVEFPNDIPPSQDYEIRKKLKNNEYWLPISSIDGLDVKPKPGRIVTLNGANDYIQVYRNILQSDPKHLRAAYDLATELWNRGRFSEATEIIETYLQHVKDEDKNQLNKQISFLDQIGKPYLKLFNDKNQNKLTLESMAKDGVTISARHWNSPSTVLSIEEINFEKVINDIFDELGAITDKDQLEEQFSAITNKNIWEYRIKPKRDVYCTPYGEAMLNLQSPRPNEWFFSEVQLPIKKEGMYLVEDKKNKQEPHLFVEIPSFIYFIRPTINGHECLCVDRETGSPLAQAKGVFHIGILSDEKFYHEILQCESNEKGIFKFDIPFKNLSLDTNKLVKLLIAGSISKNDKISIVAPEGFYINLVNKNQLSLNKEKEELLGYFEFDKPAYEAGDIVHGQYIIKPYTTNKLIFPNIKNLLIKLSAYILRDNKSIKAPQNPNDFGIIDFQFEIPRNEQFSNIDVSADFENSQGYQIINQKSTIPAINEQMVSPPINITLKNSKIELNRPFTIEFAPTSSSSLTIPQGHIKYSLIYQEDYYGWLTHPDSHWMIYEPINPADEFDVEIPIDLIEGEITLDKQGKASFEFHNNFQPACFQKNKNQNSIPRFRSYSYQIKGTYVDPDGESFPIKKVFHASTNPLLLADYPSNNFAEEGKPFHITWEAHSVNGTKTEGIKGTIEMVRYKTESDYKKSFLGIRKDYWDAASENNAVIQTWHITSNDKGKATLEFTPTIAGLYELKGTWIDQEGGVSYTNTPLYIAGENIQSPFDSIQIIPNKREYNPNEEITLLITAPSSSGTIWLDSQSGMEHAVTQTYPVKNGYAIVRVKPTDQYSLIFSVNAIHAHHDMVSSRQKHIVILPDSQILNVQTSIVDNKNNPKLANLVIDVTDKNGKPIPNASLFVSIYDANLDNVNTEKKLHSFFKARDWNSPYLHRFRSNKATLSYPKHLYYQPITSIRSSYSGQMTRVPSSRWERTEISYFGIHYPSKPGDYDQKHLTPELSDELHHPPYEWSSSLLFSSDLQTDSQGKVSIPFTLPVESSSWRIKAKACTKDLKEGYTQKLWNFEKSN